MRHLRWSHGGDPIETKCPRAFALEECYFLSCILVSSTLQLTSIRAVSSRSNILVSSDPLHHIISKLSLSATV